MREKSRVNTVSRTSGVSIQVRAADLSGKTGARQSDVDRPSGSEIMAEDAHKFHSPMWLDRIKFGAGQKMCAQTKWQAHRLVTAFAGASFGTDFSRLRAATGRERHRAVLAVGAQQVIGDEQLREG